MTPSARDERRWTLIDQSEDYTPRWKVANERGPAAGEYAESVEVMPVSEHEAALAAARQVDEARPVKLARTPSYETVADLGNGIQLESYWPERNAEPLFAVRQGRYPAFLKPAQIAPLRSALAALLAALTVPEPENVAEPGCAYVVTPQMKRLADEHVRLEADLAALREAAQAVVEFRDDFVSACQRGGLSDVLVREQEAWDALRAVLASADSEEER
jgi:hypothetical protein